MQRITITNVQLQIAVIALGSASLVNVAWHAHTHRQSMLALLLVLVGGGASGPPPSCHGGVWPAAGDITYTSRFKEHFSSTALTTLEKYLSQRPYSRFNPSLVARLAQVDAG